MLQTILGNGVQSLSSLFSSCSIPSKRGLHHPSRELVSMCWHALLHDCHSWPCSGKCRASDTLLLNIYIRFPLLFPILRNLRLDRGISQWHCTVQQSKAKGPTHPLATSHKSRDCFQFHYEFGAVPPSASRTWTSDEYPVFRDPGISAINPSTVRL